jgi:hypothetical protein
VWASAASCEGEKETNKKEKKNYNNDPTRLYQGGKDTESKGKPVMETLLRLYQIEEKRKETKYTCSGPACNNEETAGRKIFCEVRKGSDG